MAKSKLSKNLKILIVDDDPDDVLLVSDLTKESLKPFNVDLIHFNAEGDIIDQLSRSSFDLCILDLRLGSKDGIQILKMIKKAGLSLPVIFLTGQGDQETAVKAMKAGASDYVVKGNLKKENFAKSLSDAIQNHRRHIEFQQGERLLERQRNLLVAISEGSKALLTKNQPEAGIRKALSILGRSLNAEIAWVCTNRSVSEKSSAHMEILYTWGKREGEESESEHKALLDKLSQGSFHESLSKGNILEISKEDIPGNLTKHNIETLQLIPIGFNEDYWGILVMGFSGMKIAFTKDIDSLLTTFASTLGGQIRRLNEEDLFYSIVEGTSGNMGEGFFSSLVKSLGHALSVDHVLICEVQNFSDKFCQLVSGWDGVKEYSGSKVKIFGTPAEEMLAGLNSFIPDNLTRQYDFDWFSHNGQINSFAGVPFFNADSKVQGFLCVAGKHSMKSSDRILSTLKIFAARTGAELERQKVEKKMRDMAYHDSLTGLPNRVLLEDRLKVALTHAERNKLYVALLFMDFDNFKMVNDDYGHQNGDLMLKEQSKRIIQCLRKGDTVARFGGDEFVLLLPYIQQPSDAAKLALKVNEAVKPPIKMEGKEVKTSVSIGISLFPTDGRDSKSLLKRADDALFEAKRKGRDSFVFATPFSTTK